MCCYSVHYPKSSPCHRFLASIATIVPALDQFKCYKLHGVLGTGILVGERLWKVNLSMAKVPGLEVVHSNLASVFLYDYDVLVLLDVGKWICCYVQ